MGRILSLAALSLFLVHCSKAPSTSFTQVPAPQNAQDLGWITNVSASQLADLQATYPEARIRSLNSARELFEISNITSDNLQKVIGQQQLTKNVFVQGSTFSKKMEWGKDFVGLNTSKDAMDAMQTCQMTDKSPLISAEVSFNKTTLTIELGESVTITAKGTPHPAIGGTLRYLWDMAPPGFSRQTFTAGIADAQTFTPDSPGLYQVALIAQGTDLSCNFRMIPILVTANPTLNTQLSSMSAPPERFFHHLNSIQARAAWNQSKGQGVVVAVLDSGLNYNHPAIQPNIQMKNVENKIDEDVDGNGFKNDFMGWDFANGDNLPFDDDGHGSHVAGLISSSFAGVAPDSKVLPIKVLNAAGSSDLGTVVAGILYAVDSGAKIINMSLGFEGRMPPPPLERALEVAREKGVFVLAAAGNGDSRTGLGLDIKVRPTYPASLQKDNMITIAATAQGNITRYSNFSSELVQLAAPGGNEREFMISLATINPARSAINGLVGTSMATPVVAGVAALALSANPTLTPNQIKTLLMETGDTLEALNGKVSTGKQVNAAAAVQKALDLQPVTTMN